MMGVFVAMKLPLIYNSLIGEKMEKRRENIIIKTSVRDMLANLIIGILELLVGAMSNSVAVTSDGVNSFTSSAIALINVRGVKLSKKSPDKRHPYGYGRNEYFTIILIAALLIVLAIILGYRSITNIFSDSVANYPYYTIILIGVSACIKIYLGRHAKKTGKKLNAASLCLIGRHTLLEAALEIATIFTIVLSLLANIYLDAYLGIFVAGVILFTGINIGKDYMDTLIGHNIPAELANEIKREIAKEDIVMGAYDLAVHDYGYNKKIGTCNVEISETHSLNEVYEAINRIKKRIKAKYSILINIEIYSVNILDIEIVEVREKLRKISKEYDNVLGMHGFYLSREKKFIKMDLLIDFNEQNAVLLADKIRKRMEEEEKGYRVVINIDRG